MTRMTQTVLWFLAAALCLTLFLPDILLVAFVSASAERHAAALKCSPKRSRRSLRIPLDLRPQRLARGG